MRPIVTYAVPMAQPTGPAGGSSQAAQPDRENKSKQEPQHKCNAEADEGNDRDDLAQNSASVDIRLVGVSDAGGLDFFHRVRTQVPGDGSEETEEDADDAEDQKSVFLAGALAEPHHIADRRAAEERRSEDCSSQEMGSRDCVERRDSVHGGWPWPAIVA